MELNELLVVYDKVINCIVNSIGFPTLIKSNLSRAGNNVVIKFVCSNKIMYIRIFTLLSISEQLF